MQIQTKDKLLLVDILCFKSLIKIVFFKKEIDKIIYFNTHVFIKPFINLISKKINKPIIPVNNVVLSAMRIGNKSVYESVENSVYLYLEQWVDSDLIQKNIKGFIADTNFCLEKYKEHIKISAYPLIRRPVEMQKITESFECLEESYFLLKKTPMADFFKESIYKGRVYFYHSSFFLPGLIHKRDHFYYDNSLADYATLRIETIKLIYQWTVSLLSIFLTFFKKTNRPDPGNIVVELLQNKFRPYSLNDIFWLPNSSINPQTVYGISSIDYDKKSIDLLIKSNINLVSTIEIVAKHPSILFKAFKYFNIVQVRSIYFIETFKSFVNLVTFIFKGCEDNWLSYQGIKYIIRVKYWSEIYRNLGASILWSMGDTDLERLIKAQAIELNNGLYLGSHWSNYSLPSVGNQKFYDVNFPWSEHFLNNFFTRYKYKKSYIVGYPADCFFGQNDATLSSLKKVRSKMFVISYFDNIFSNDLPYSESMQIEIHRMLFRVLNKHDNVVLYLKPKKISFLEDLKATSQEIKLILNSPRVRIFTNSADENRIMPSHVGMLSDLAIGLGISTAAAECCFSGTVSFHVDMMNISNNYFSNIAIDKVVFRSIKNLELAIERQIIGGGISIDECKDLHKCLDNYQDGLAYKRTGSIIKQIQSNFRLGLNKDVVLKGVKLNSYF